MGRSAEGWGRRGEGRGVREAREDAGKARGAPLRAGPPHSPENAHGLTLRAPSRCPGAPAPAHQQVPVADTAPPALLTGACWDFKIRLLPMKSSLSMKGLQPDRRPCPRELPLHTHPTAVGKAPPTRAAPQAPSRHWSTGLGDTL